MQWHWIYRWISWKNKIFLAQNISKFRYLRNLLSNFRGEKRVESQSKSQTTPIAKRCGVAEKALPILNAIRFGEARLWSCTDRIRREERRGLVASWNRRLRGPLIATQRETSLWKLRTLEARKMLRHGANRKYRGTVESRRSSDGRSLNPV